MTLVDKIKTYYVNHKKLCLGTLAGVAVILIGALLLFPSPQTRTPGQLTPTGAVPPTGQQIKTSVDKDVFNPMISNDELIRVEQGQRKEYEQQGKQFPERQTGKFQFELSPELQKKNSFRLVQPAYAANLCNIVGAPATLTAYTLLTHLTIKDAQEIANSFLLTGEPASLPMPDGVSFQYYFADAGVSKFLNVSEPSGTFYYHKASDSAVPTGINITLSQSKVLTDAELSTLKLSDKIVLKSSSFDVDKGGFDVLYAKDYGYKLVDNNTISALGSASTCGVTGTVAMNEIEGIVSTQGELKKFVNHTRRITGTYPLKRQELKDSLNEYGKNPPVPPVVPDGSPITGPVIIDEAVIVYYDYGEGFGQTAYVPMYLTSGKTSVGTRVFGLFPAISKKELDKTPIPNLRQSRDVLQLETFNPKPAKKPEPPKPVPGKPGKLCYGNLIDYDIECVTEPNLNQVCSKYIEAPAQVDPYGVCSTGCTTKSQIINVAPGVNPCTEFINSLNILSKPAESKPGTKFKGGEYRCQVHGCPC